MAREISKGKNLVMKCKALGCGSDTVTIIEDQSLVLSQIYGELQKMMQVHTAHSGQVKYFQNRALYHG